MMFVSILCYLSLVSSAALGSLNSGKTIRQQGAPWGLARLSHSKWKVNEDVEKLWTDDASSYVYHESSQVPIVTIYILDTGVEVGHPEFDGRASLGVNLVTDEDDQDLCGHGTHVAGVAVGKNIGVARQAQLVSVKILNATREGSIETFCDGVNWVIADHKKKGGHAVINYSAVGEISQLRDNCIEKAQNSGVFVVSAAGNTAGDACKTGPPNLSPTSGLLTVAALNWTNTPATFSSTGNCVDIWAPGVGIISCMPGNDYGFMAGTSIAAAFVTGLVGYLWGENPNLSLADMTAAVKTANSNALKGASFSGAIAYNYATST